MICNNVRSVRLAKGINASHVARFLGISRQSYYYREAGKVEISSEEMKSISSILGEEVSVFFDEKLTKSVLRRIKKEAGLNARARRSEGA